MPLKTGKSMSSFFSGNFSMIDNIKNLKIFNFIIKRISIYMMNMLSSIKWSFKKIFHYKPMFKDFFSFNVDKLIFFLGFCYRRKITCSRAIPFYPNSRRRNRERFFTFNTFHFFACRIMSNFVFKFCNSFLFSNWFCKIPQTFSRTTFCRFNTIGFNIKNIFTNLTINRYSHAII